MKISIRTAGLDDLKEYTQLLQQTYQDAYTNEDIGLTKDCFSKEVFSTERIKEYLLSNLLVNDTQKAWLAFFDSKLIGAITIIDRGPDYELRGFYVASNYQGKGIGKQLWEKARTFAKGKDITLDIYAHNRKTISMYLKWGFVIYETKKRFSRQWPEWQKSISIECLYMRLKEKKEKVHK